MRRTWTLIAGFAALALVLVAVYAPSGRRVLGSRAAKPEGSSASTSSSSPAEPRAGEFEPEFGELPGDRTALTALHRSPDASPILESRTLCVTLVDRSGAELIDGLTVPDAVRLWNPRADTVLDQGAVRPGATVDLEFPAGVEEGWVTVDLDRQPQGFGTGPPSWFLAPDQPGYAPGVMGRLSGVRVRPGDVRKLVMAPGGILRGRVVGTSDIPARSVRVYLRSMLDPGSRNAPIEERGQRRETPVQADGSFELTGLDAGPRRLRLSNEGRWIHSIEHVEVRLGEVCADPRVALIDLGTLTRTITLEVEGAGGEPIEKPVAVLIFSGQRAESFGEGGVLRIPLPHAVGSDGEKGDYIMVLAAGYAPKRLEPPFGDDLLVLDPSLKLRVVASDPFAAEVGSYRYKFRLRKSGSSKAVADLFSTVLPSKWTTGEPVEVALPSAGRFDLEVLPSVRSGGIVFRPSDSGWTSTGVQLEVPVGAAQGVVLAPRDLGRFR